MMRSREFERRAGLLSRQGVAWFHLPSSGHEGLAGAAGAFGPDDLIFPHYRDRALLMARSMSVADMTRDLIASRGSHSRGRNMGSHFSDRRGNVFSIASPVASQCLPAVGAAWAQQLAGGDEVVLCSIGEASTRQGEFFEAIMFAVDRKLPVVFLVSDNGYGISTPTQGLAPVHMPVLHDSLVTRVDGVDPEVVRDAALVAVRKARTGGGPSVLWCELDRLDSHTSSDDQRVYRSPGEIASMRDPIQVFADRLILRGTLSREDVSAEWDQVRIDVEEEFSSIIGEAVDEVANIHSHLFSASCNSVIEARGRFATIVDAINGTLRRGLAEIPEMLMFGEDIEDPKGGVFGFTKGLGSAAGGRVFNSPLAEATIVGAAVGLASVGRRPVVELQFIDFAGPAWNQISNQVATLRWRTVGEWACPLVIYAPYGAYLPGGGIWHSQSNEALFTHIPGLRVAVIGNPVDAELVFLDAFASDDPTLILIPKHLMRIRHSGEFIEPVPRGRARVVTAGTEVTLVTWGNGVEIAMNAVSVLASHEVSVEVIDLRWLVPWDRQTVVNSLHKTGRLIVLQEDNRTSSFGAGLITDLITEDDNFAELLAPPRLVARDDIHIPFHPDLELAVMPALDGVVRAVLSTVD
ncbi:branched-chain alpha-keto acid dehydrogenase [Nocardia panacis]|uniref:dihydrolipoyllysine-residue succinyltransferase n=2 Tax=Nocardia panacis TaxID=2340916 RepID=A0A3A4KHK1_9NOCA|nr:branched-chain alpha-keto acid dehydrogenase [Nocardia panacis]